MLRNKDNKRLRHKQILKSQNKWI